MQEKDYLLRQCTEQILKGANVKVDKQNPDNDIEYYEINMSHFIENNIELDLKEDKKRGNEEQIKSRRLKKGDIIIPARSKTINKMAIFNIDTPTPCMVNHQYWIIRPEASLLNSYYLLSYLLNKDTKGILNISNQMSGTSIMNISLDSLKNLKLKLPPMEEQKKMESILKSLQKVNGFKDKLIRVQNSVNSINYDTNATDSIINQLNSIEIIMDTLSSEFDKLNVIAVPEEFI